MAGPFTVSAPRGARIRDRLRLPAHDAEVLCQVGRHLGHLARVDLAERVRIGDVAAKETRRADRKKLLTARSSSRWAGAITRVSEDQYQLSKRCLLDERAGLRRAVRKLTARLKAECGRREQGARGYTDQAERFEKQRRLSAITTRLTAVERRIETGRPAVVVGGRRLAKVRHNLPDAGLTEHEWRRRWHAERMFLTADGESGAPYGNYTITVEPDGGGVTIVLPAPLRHHANEPRGRYRLSCTARFSHRREEWLDRVTSHRAVRYDIVYEPVRDRWYLDASWSTAKAAPSTPEQLAARGARLLGVDLNADHLAACVVDPHGNPVGEPFTVSMDLSGRTPRRDGRLRTAISEVLHVAEQHGCAGIAIEDLGFAVARATGRETMGRGRRGKCFRRTVAGIPTARFRERLRGMAYHRGLTVIAVDPAYTSRWGGQHWHRPLQQQTHQTTATRHHAASVAIGRRALGHGARRRPGVTVRHRRMAARRATGQTVPRPRACGAPSPPRTPGTPHRGGKTCGSRSDQLVLFPVPKTVRGATGPCPAHSDAADTGRHR
ncbi:hypothetical protein [Streptomyces lunalinharesii]|uniref:IS200/IS605 family element transposase accessory protein TnpB n=1 Tax=Streptomyces lunalinharesii TaxID=333384 RepID=A0ABN3SRN7_9ACTN